MKKNVYIATLPRSGSTVLGLLLGSHSNMCHIGESSYWGKICPDEIRCSCGKIGCEFLNRIYGKIKGVETVKSIYTSYCSADKSEEPNKDYHALSIPDKETTILKPEQYDYHLRQSVLGLEKIADAARGIFGTDIIIDNTKLIDLAFNLAERKEWKIILLTRDPRGMAYSNKRAGLRKGVVRTVESKISVYVNFAKKAQRLIGKDSILHVKYEDLCAYPEIVLRNICNFLGEDYEPSILKFREIKTHHTLMGNRLRFDNNQTIVEDLQWREGLKSEEKKLLCLNADITSLYGKLGYNIVDE